MSDNNRVYLAIWWDGGKWIKAASARCLADARVLARRHKDIEHVEVITLNRERQVCFVRGGNKYDPDITLERADPSLDNKLWKSHLLDDNSVHPDLSLDEPRELRAADQREQEDLKFDRH